MNPTRADAQGDDAIGRQRGPFLVFAFVVSLLPIVASLVLLELVMGGIPVFAGFAFVALGASASAIGSALTWRLTWRMILSANATSLERSELEAVAVAIESERKAVVLQKTQVIEELEALKKARGSGTSEAVVDGLGVGVIVTDTHDQILSANNAALRFLGLERERIVGRTLTNLFPSLSEMSTYDLDLGTRIVAESARDDNEEMQLELIFGLASDEGLRSWALYFAPDARQEEAREWRFLADRDIFLTNINHRLRTPLASIIGYTELIEDEALDTGASAFLPELEKIHTCALELLKFVDDSMDLSKMSLGLVPLNIEEVDVAHLLEEVALVVNPLAGAVGKTFLIRSKMTQRSMKGDPIRLRDALQNVLTTAVKRTPGTRVMLEVALVETESEQTVVFEVPDVSLDEDELAGLLAPLDASGATRTDLSGAGLSLGLAQHYCQSMGGEISLSGSRLVLTLPYSPSEERLARAMGQSSSAIAAARGRDLHDTSGQYVDTRRAWIAKRNRKISAAPPPPVLPPRLPSPPALKGRPLPTRPEAAKKDADKDTAPRPRTLGPRGGDKGPS